VYRGSRSITAKVQVGSGARALQRECAFPLDTALEEIVRWQEETRNGLRASAVAASRTPLEADVERYLRALAITARGLAVRRSQLRPWIEELGHKRRQQLRSREIEQTMFEWLAQGVAPKTILNRYWALHHMLVTLAGSRHAWTPLANVDLSRLAIVRKARR
jgi:hypothetical protein